MTEWKSKGQVARAAGHAIEIVDGVATVFVEGASERHGLSGTKPWRRSYGIDELKELVDLYASAYTMVNMLEVGRGPDDEIMMSEALPPGSVLGNYDAEPIVGTEVEDKNRNRWKRSHLGWHLYLDLVEVWARTFLPWETVRDLTPLTVIENKLGLGFPLSKP